MDRVLGLLRAGQKSQMLRTSAGLLSPQQSPECPGTGSHVALLHAGMASRWTLTQCWPAGMYSIDRVNNAKISAKLPRHAGLGMGRVVLLYASHSHLQCSQRSYQYTWKAPEGAVPAP